jgi:ABC-type glycerol-3-phosphate transport system substrate-binding protein
MERRTFLKVAAQTAAAAAILPPVLETTNAVAGPAQANQTKVTFWQFQTDNNSLAAWRKIISDFNAKNRDVLVEMVIVPWAEQAQKLTTAISTGSAPDVSMMGNDVVAQYAAIGALAPLDSYFQAWSKEVGSDITQDMYPGDHLYYKWKNSWYASPIAEETRLVYYRKSFLKAANIDPSKAFATYDSMLKAAQALNKPSKGIYGWGIPGAIAYYTVQTFAPIYLAWGAQFLNSKGLCGFDTPEFRAALTWYTDLYKHYKVTPPDTPIYDDSKLNPLFEAGKMALYISGPWLTNLVTDASIKADLGYAQLPRGPKRKAAFLGGWPLVMWSQSHNKDATFRFIRYVTDPKQALQTICLGAGQLPGRKSMAAKTPYNAMPNSIFINQLNFAYPYQYPVAEIPQMGSLEVSAVQTAVQSVMLGKSSVDQAAKDLVSHINAVLQP